MESNSAGRGKLLVLGTILFIAIAVLTLQGWRIATGNIRLSGFGPVFLTLLLLWKIWEGEAWSRWVLAGTSGAAAIVAMIMAVIQNEPGMYLTLVPVAVVCAAISAIFSLSPSITAFQANQRLAQAEVINN